MKLWLRTAEMADLAAKGELPGIPTTKRGINELAARENWHRYHALVRNAEGSEGGGGLEFHVEQLPLATRLAYIARQFDFDPASVRRDIGDDGLTQKARELRDAKVFVVKMADAFKKQVGLASHASDRTFCDLYNAGSIDVPDWVKQAVKSLCRRSLVNYRKAIAEDANQLGKDPALSRKGTGLLETANGGEVRIFILGLLGQPGPHSAKNVRKFCRSEFGDEIVDRHGELRDMPPERTFQHFIKELKANNQVMLTKLTDPDKFRSHYRMSGVGAYRHITEPNELWQIDASPVDALCIDGRHSIYMCVDIATRRIVITLSRTPRASAVGLLTRKALLQLGVAKLIMTDNGSDFVAEQTQRLFRHLGVDVHRSEKYTPEQKGHVERVIGTFQRDMSQNLPGYIGHSVADRKAIEGRKGFAKRLGQTEAETFEVSLTAAQLQQKIDDWVEYTYSQSGHSGFGMNGRSPAEVAAASTTVIRRVDERALDVLLAPVPGSNGIRIVTKQGIRIDGFYYLAGRIMPRTPVLVRMDPMDAGRILAFSQDGSEFLSEAICAELRGIKPSSLVKAEKAIQAEMIADALKPVKAAMRRLAKGPALIDRALEVDKRDHAARQAANANVIPLPKREERHTTAHIEAAIEALQPAPRIAPISTGVADKHRQMMAEFDGAAEKVTALRAEETAAQRFRRLHEIEQRRERGEPVSEHEAYELGSYQQSAEYKTRKMMLEDFGDQAPGLRT